MTQALTATSLRLRSLRLLRSGLWVSGILLAGVGCAQTRLLSQKPPTPTTTATAESRSSNVTAAARTTRSPYLELGVDGWRPAGTSKADAQIVQTSASESAMKPTQEPAKEGPKSLPPQEPKAPEPLAMPTPTAPELPASAANHQIPISLDTVFRLAEEQNAQVSLARERVNEAYAEKCIAQRKWLPDIYVGTAYDRHEGGIQLQEGPLIHSSTGAMFNGLEIDGRFDIREIAYQRVNAQRKLWQQKGDLSRVTSETLLEAANTYIDMLAARTAHAIVREEQEKLTELLKQARSAADDLLPQADITRIEAEIEGQSQLLAKFRSQAAAAGAKIVYLLQLDPMCELVPVDQQLVPFDLIDPNMSMGDLIDHALRNGPGVNEMEGLLATIHDAMAKSKSTEFMPTLEARMAEGVFGAGPGASSTWDNRWDLGLQARWNLSPLLTRCDRLRAAQAKVNQAHVAYQDLRGKLTAGVQEALITSIASKEQIERGATQIDKAKESFTQSNTRRTERPTRYPFTDVFLSISSLTRARLSYVAAVSEHDKAQVRLLVLLGPGASHAMGLEMKCDR